MKINFEIDCTPSEAREFLGLPDVRGLQAEVMKRLEERLLKTVEATSPQEMLQNWFVFNTGGAKQIQDLFKGFLAAGADAFPGAAKEKQKP